MIRQYRKKPVVIEAVEWDGTNYEEICVFTELERVPRDSDDRLYIQTLEGGLWASIGDFIICGIQHEFYPCKPDIFLRTYEEQREVGHVDTPEAL